MPFGKVLKSLRTRNKMTQKQLADVLHVSESRIGMYERSRREPDFEMLEAIADYFNVDMDFLTGRSDIERQYTFPDVNPSVSLSHEEETLVADYRDASDEIRAAAARMLHDSAESQRKEKSASTSNVG